MYLTCVHSIQIWYAKSLKTKIKKKIYSIFQILPLRISFKLNLLQFLCFKDNIESNFEIIS